MSATEISPAPSLGAVAIREPARGNTIASEPRESSSAIGLPAPTLHPAPEPTCGSQANLLTARVHDSPAPIEVSSANDPSAQGSDVPPVALAPGASHTTTGDGWVTLRMWSEMYFDVQKTRIACKNRIERGGGIDGTTFTPQLDVLQATEDGFKRALLLAYRRHVPQPIRDWQKATPGIGEPALARLLGHLGHPAIAEPHHWEETPDGDDKRILVADEPYLRSLRQLWAYCGHGDAARKRAKGMEQTDALAMGSPVCKMIVHQLLATSCMKAVGGEVEISGKLVTRARSPFRDVYEARREVTAGRDGWTDMHAMNDALRITGKEILRDLWIVSREAL